jgi:predicted dehydrogenase
MKDLMDDINAGESPAPTFEDAYRVQAVLDAVERSAEGGGWTRPETGGI